MNCVFITHNSIRTIFDFFAWDGLILLNVDFQADTKNRVKKRCRGLNLMTC